MLSTFEAVKAARRAAPKCIARPALLRCSRRVMPVKVPLVPSAATKCVTRPPVCSMISGAGGLEMRLPVRRIIVLIRIEISVRVLFVNGSAHSDGAVGTFAGVR